MEASTGPLFFYQMSEESTIARQNLVFSKTSKTNKKAQQI